MINYYLRTILRVLMRNKLFSFITIGGYAISMAVVFLLSIFIVGELQINHNFDNSDQIYRLKLGEGVKVPMSLMDDINDQVSGVENVCLYNISDKAVHIKETKKAVRCLTTNDDFFKIFSYDTLFSSSNMSLEVENHIILSKSFAEKWFGTSNPIGEMFDIRSVSYLIVGVIDDLSSESSFEFDIVLGLSHSKKHFIGNKKDGISHKELMAFVSLNENADPTSIASTITKINQRWHQYRKAKISLQPLREVYFDSSAKDNLQHAPKQMIHLLWTITLLILIMTVFNYVQLTLAKGIERHKEIAIIKTVGASSRNVFNQFLAESIIVSLLSFFVALAVSFLISPILSQLLGKPVGLTSVLGQGDIIVFIVLLIGVIGFVAGVLPAIVFSRVAPNRMLKDTLIKRAFANGSVVVFQFLITITLLISVLCVEKQINFVKCQDLGFDKEMIIRLELQGKAKRQSSVLKEMILAHPSIISASGTTGSPIDFSGTGNSTVEINGHTENVDWRMFNIDEDFLETFGIDLILGENINRAKNYNGCLINERYYKNQGWSDLNGKKIYGSDVVGVVEDFHFDDLHHKIGFLVLEVSGGADDILNVKVQGNIQESISHIQKCYAEIEPESSVNYQFYDDWIQTKYEKEESQAKAVKVFSLFAIFISCLGLFGMTEHLANKRTKEIGIRKVNGATISDILLMLNKDFIKWVAIAFVIAVPIAYYAMSKWLENFAYKTELSWWIFALAGVVALGVAMLTVSWQSWRAAQRNPVESLRYE